MIHSTTKKKEICKKKKTHKSKKYPRCTKHGAAARADPAAPTANGPTAVTLHRRASASGRNVRTCVGDAAAAVAVFVAAAAAIFVAAAAAAAAAADRSDGCTRRARNARRAEAAWAQRASRCETKHARSCCEK